MSHAFLSASGSKKWLNCPAKSTVPDVLNMYKDKYDELEEILLKEV